MPNSVNNGTTNGTTRSESLISYLGTLGRKKKIKEVKELETEGKAAIDRNQKNPIQEIEPEDFILNEYEERTMIHPSVFDKPEFQDLQRILIAWINDELIDERIIVRKLDEDLYDGKILGKLLEKLSENRLDVVELIINEDLQKMKLRSVLDTVNRIFGAKCHKWTVEGIHNKDLIQIIHLLIALVQHFQPPIRLPSDVSVSIVCVQKRDGRLHSRMITEQLTGTDEEMYAALQPRDAFDALFDEKNDDKLMIVKRSLANFVNRHLSKINIEVESGKSGDDLNVSQFSDGLLFVFLMGLLNDYFVPLGNIFTTINNEQLNQLDDTAFQSLVKNMESLAISKSNYVNSCSMLKFHNVNVAFQLMDDAGLEVRKKVRPEDIVNGNVKSTLRIIYMLFTKYKHLE